jgi:hypothetical protein
MSGSDLIGLQRNLRPFLRGKPKRAPVERFRSYGDLEQGNREKDRIDLEYLLRNPAS